MRLFGEAPPAGQRLEFTDVRAAEAFVAARMSDTRDAHVLRRLVGEIGPGVAVDDHDVVRRLAAAIVAGRLVLMRPGAAPAVRIGGSDEDEPAREDEDGFEALQKPPPTHWIEIELVDEDEQAIVGERYVIVTGDGVEWRGFTNSLGVARLGRIPDGDCKVCFPDLAPNSWRRL